MLVIVHRQWYKICWIQQRVSYFPPITAFSGMPAFTIQVDTTYSTCMPTESSSCCSHQLLTQRSFSQFSLHPFCEACHQLVNACRSKKKEPLCLCKLIHWSKVIYLTKIECKILQVKNPPVCGNMVAGLNYIISLVIYLYIELEGISVKHMCSLHCQAYVVSVGWESLYSI